MMEVPLVSFWSTDGISAGGDFICPASWVMRNFLSSAFSSLDFSPSGEPPLFILKKEKSGITQSSLSYRTYRTAAVICRRKKVSLQWTLLRRKLGFGRPMLSSAPASGWPGQVISFTYHCVIAQTEMYRSHVMNTRYSIFDDLICSSWKLHIIQVQVQFLQEATEKKWNRTQENSFFFPIQILVSFCGKKFTFKTLGKW